MRDRTLVSSLLLAGVLAAFANTAYATSTNIAQIGISPGFIGGTGPYNQNVVQPGLIYISGAATGGFSSSGSASVQVNYGLIHEHSQSHGALGNVTHAVFRDALTITSPGVPTGTSGTLTYSVRVEGSLGASIGFSTATWGIQTDLGGGSFDLTKTGHFNSPANPPAGYSGDPLGTYTATISFQYGISMPMDVEMSCNSAAGVSSDNVGGEAHLDVGLYWLGITDVKANGTPVGTFSVASESGTPWGSNTVAVDPALPRETRLDAVAPNPVIGSSAISFDLARAGRVREEIFDLEGRLVKSLRDGDLPAGHYADRWQRDDDAGRAVHQGVYVVRLAAPGVNQSRKLVVTR